MSVALSTEAWLLRGLSQIPGTLTLKNGVLSFTTLNTGSAWPWQLRKLERDYFEMREQVVTEREALRKLERELGERGLAAAIDAGKPTRVFEWKVCDLEAQMPWYEFGGGLRVSRGQVKLRLSFGEPASNEVVADPIRRLAHAVAQWRQVGIMRGRGRQWAAALETAQAQASVSGP